MGRFKDDHGCSPERSQCAETLNGVRVTQGAARSDAGAMKRLLSSLAWSTRVIRVVANTLPSRIIFVTVATRSLPNHR